MKMFFRLFFMLCLVALPALAGDFPDSTRSVAFSHAYLSVEGGEKYPFGDLVDAVDNSLYGGVGFRYTYWEDFDGVVLLHYSYFEPHGMVPRINGVHEVSGKLGLDYRWSKISPVAFGAGFLCNWTRADYRGEKKDFDFGNDLGATLTDNETEFGWFARLNLPIFTYGNYRVGFDALWEELWTLPERSDMLTVGLYVERRLW